MFAAGLFAGAGVLVKQSGYDGGLAAGLWLLLAAWRGWRPGRRSAPRARGARARRRADRRSGGAARGADRVPRLVVRGRRLPPLGRERRDRLGVREVLALHRLAAHGRACRGDAGRARAPGPLAGAPPSARSTLLAIWFVLSLTGFALGGLFHGHYYVGPLTPLCALAALTLAAVPPRLGLALGLAALVLPVYKAWPAYTADGTRERSLASTLGLAHRQGRRRRPLPARAHALGRPRLRALRRREPLPRRRAGARPIRTSGSSASSTSRARCSACATRSPGPDAPRYIAVYQQPAHDRQARRHRPHPQAPLPPRRDDRGRADLALAACRTAPSSS